MANDEGTAVVEPHAYEPSLMHMGDCRVCGNVEHSFAHSSPVEMRAWESKIRAEARRLALMEAIAIVDDRIAKLEWDAAKERAEAGSIGPALNGKLQEAQFIASSLRSAAEKGK